MGYYNSFLVNIWISENQKIIRGRVIHIGTQEMVYFLGFDKLEAFIMNHLAPPPNHQPKHEEEADAQVSCTEWGDDA
jgi:hypothetical protein